MSDLVERLRDLHRRFGHLVDLEISNGWAETAAALTAKDKEIEALRDELESYNTAYNSLMRVNAARAETAERELNIVLACAKSAEARAETAERRVAELEGSFIAATKAYDRASARAIRFQQERDELQQVFDSRWDADQRAIKAWQAAHPDRSTTWPDRADMVVWLLSALDEARAELKSEARAETAERELTREREAFQRHVQTLNDNGIASHSEAVVLVTMLRQVFDDILDELGCERDNDSALEAIATLRRERDEARAALKPFTAYSVGAIFKDESFDYRVHVCCSVEDQPSFKHFDAARAVIEQGE